MATADADRANSVSPAIAQAPAAGWLRGPIATVVLLALCATLYLPGLFTMPPVDRDECKFAQASRQMLATQDWVVPRIGDRPRLNKPPMIYWLQAASARLLGETPAMAAAPFPGGADPTAGIGRYRLPSAIAATITVLLVFWLGTRMFDRRAAILGAALLAVCPVFAWEAHQARADQVLVATIVIAQSALWSIWHTRRSPRRPVLAPAVLWLALCAGVMTKGPVAPMVVGLTALTLALLQRDWRFLIRLRPLIGGSIVLGAIATWLALVAGHVGWSHLSETLWRELIGRNLEAAEGHWGPPGYHLLLLNVLFWPGTLAVLFGVGRAWQRGLRAGSPAGPAAAWPARMLRHLRSRRPARDAEVFCLAWLIPAWIVFELVGTKLPHYTMPLYPPLALLCARAAFALAARHRRTGQPPLDRAAVIIWSVLGAVIVVAVPAAAGAFVVHGDRSALAPNLLSFPLRIAATTALFYAAVLLWRHGIVRAQVASIGAIVAGVVALMVVLPHVPGLWVSNQILARIRESDQSMSLPVAVVGFREDSLVFLSNGGITRLNMDHVPEWFSANPGGRVFVPKEEVAACRYLVGRPMLAEEQYAVSGINYSDRLRSVDLVPMRFPP
ncbi:MAG: glycosyltransferase family 39 protein [Phycisphaeraceae bacterium]|nr:glycosyltransferase family 39 protein [Phycisphaeraceae bacterium]